MTDCPLSGHCQGHVSNFYILVLENFATASRRCTGVINELLDGQLVDYTYDSRVHCGRMHKFIISWSTVTFSFHYFDLFWTCTSCSYTTMQQLARFLRSVCGSRASCCKTKAQTTPKRSYGASRPRPKTNIQWHRQLLLLGYHFTSNVQDILH